MDTARKSDLLYEGAPTEVRFAGFHSPDVETERLARGARERVMAEIERLDLRRYIGDLEIDGFTILPPDIGGSAACVAAWRGLWMLPVIR